MTPEDIHAAQAILASCRAKLSGHEIDLLDRIANAETAEFELTRLARELAAAHEEGEEQARLLGMSAEREAGLLAKIERLERQLAKLSETP